MTLTLSTPVLSTGTLTANQFVAAVLNQQPRTTYTDFHVEKIASRIVHWCSIFGINHDIVFAQVAHETGWFRYGGDVKPEQWNFAGLGATGGVPGHSFPFDGGLIQDDGIEAGVLAVVAHHAVYRWGEKSKWPFHLRQYAGEHVDPRYDEVLSTGNAGKMFVLGDYRGTWAVPGITYPEGIINRSKVIAAFPASAGLSEAIMQRITERGIEIHDIRDHMIQHASLKYTRMSNDAWRYVAVHHTAVSRGVRGLEGDITSWRNHSAYHVHTHGWPGIAYAIGVSLSGRVFLLRDIELRGFHANDANAVALGVAGDLTTGNHITAEFRRALDAVLDVLTTAPEFPSLPGPEAVYGHRELDFIDADNAGTQCPGDVLELVRAYREQKEDAMPPPVPERIAFEGNPFGDVGFVRGFAGFVWRHGWLDAPHNPKEGILALVGYPKEEEHATEFGAEQRCEKAVLHWLKDAQPPWDIQLAQVQDVAPEPEPPDISLPLLGANYVNPEYGDWHGYQRLLGRRARFELAKIYLPDWAHWDTLHADDLISDGVRTLVLRTDDVYVGYEETYRLLVTKGWLDYIATRPEQQFVIEVGNEPDNFNWDLNRYRTDLLETATKLIPEISLPNMTWIASMPREAAAVKVVLAGGEVDELYDGIGVHLYGNYELGDDGTGALYDEVYANTTKPIWVTEFGLNDPDMGEMEKAIRYLEWLVDESERVAGIAIWLIAEPGSTRWAVEGHYPLSSPMAKLLAGRKATI